MPTPKHLTALSDGILSELKHVQSLASLQRQSGEPPPPPQAVCVLFLVQEKLEGQEKHVVYYAVSMPQLMQPNALIPVGL